MAQRMDLDWLLPSPLALAAGAGTVLFYVAFNSMLQILYYHQRRNEVQAWKVQPKDVAWQAAHETWWLPLWELVAGPRKPGRHPKHWLYGTINVLIAGANMVVAVELTRRGRTGVVFDWSEVGWFGAVRGLVVACAFENITEYVWHRILHTRWLYARLHKLHHYYKAPTPFDDMFVHPLEVSGYYLILYGPVYLFRLHWSSLLGYAAIMGITGMLDHSGIRFAVPGIYTTEDHDIHHELYLYNYGFPFPWVDQLCGTYRAGPGTAKPKAT